MQWTPKGILVSSNKPTLAAGDLNGYAHGARGSHLSAKIEIWAATMLAAVVSTMTRDERSGRVGRA
jgi:hypothetical protein